MLSSTSASTSNPQSLSATVSHLNLSRNSIQEELLDGASHWDDKTRWLRALIAIGLVALLVRLVFVRFFPNPVVLDLIWNDSVGWNFAQGNGFSSRLLAPFEPALFRTPGYPLFLALIYSIFGHSIWAVFIAQAVLDATTAVILVLLARHLFAAPIALLGGAAYALYPYNAIYCAQLHQDTLLVFLVTLLGWMLLRSNQHGRLGSWVATGLILGAVWLVKPVFALFFPIVALTMWGAKAQSREKLKRIVLVGFLAALVVTPLLWRNFREFNRFPLMAMGGVGYVLPLLVQEIDQGENAMVDDAWARSLPSNAAQSSKTPTSVSDQKATQKAALEYQKMMASTALYDENRNRAYLAQQPDGHALLKYEEAFVRRWIPELRKRPKGYLMTTLKHIPRLWITQRSVSQGSKVALIAQVLSYVVLVPGLLGMWMWRKQWRRLIYLYGALIWGTLMYAPYTVEARYTMPIRPLMLLFVVAALVLLWQKINRKDTIQTAS